MAKDKGMIPGAPPTAPGGMSRKALIAELVNKHGYVAEGWEEVSWPDLIDTVIAERQAREAEAEHAAMEATEPEVIEERQARVADDIDDLLADEGQEDEHGYRPVSEPDDLDDLLADFYDEQITEAVERPLDTEVLVGASPSTDECDCPAHQYVGRECTCSCVHTVVADETDEMMQDFVTDGVLDPETLFAEMVQARAEHEAAQPAPIFLGIPGVKDYIFDGHAGAGPSGSERWMNCTMSLSASRRFLETLTPNQQRVFAGGSTAARQGTTAHAAAEVEALRVIGQADDSEVEHTLLELTLNPIEDDEAYDEEMGEWITEYVDLVRQYAQERGDDHVLVEQRVEAVIPLAEMHEGEVYVIRGSADLAVLPTKQDRNLVVGDLKYGNGLDVDVNENPQIREYALGVLDMLADDEGNLITPIDTVTYHIIQPRLGGIKTWTESVDDLLAWRDEVLSPALTKALYGEAEGATFEPSELACQWCPARGACPALAEARTEAAAELFDAVVEAEFEDGPGSLPNAALLDSARLATLMTQAKGLVDLYSDLRAEAQRRLHRGEEVPGYWLVNHSPKRLWVEGADRELEDVPAVWTEPALMSPAAAEKALGKAEAAMLDDLIIKPDKVPLISTGEKDRRKRWEGKPPEQMFADESDGEEEA